MAPKGEMDASQSQREAKLSKLKRLGLVVNNNGNSVYLNRLSPGCIDCSRGTALTVTVTPECNRKCFFCLYRKPAKQEIKLMNTLMNIYKSRNYLLSLAITGGECLLDTAATVNILEFTKKVAGNFCQTRIYTNGDLLNCRVLKQLQAAGLEEIRISIKPNGNFEKIALARKYIPRVMVEVPVFPDQEEKMKRILVKLNRLKIFGVNLVEFVFTGKNARVYKQKGYKLMTDKVNSFSLPYAHAYPIYGSEDTALRLLEFCANNSFSIGVHYCSQNNERYGNPKARLNKVQIGKHLKLKLNRKSNLGQAKLMPRIWPGYA